MALGAVASGAASAQDEARVLHAKMHHLGDSKVEKWPGVGDEPEGKRLEIAFRATASEESRCLVVRHYHVDDPWDIVLNGKTIGQLRRTKAVADYVYFVPPGTLRTGQNTLAFEPRKPTDDIAIGKIRLHEVSFRRALKLRRVTVRVLDDRGAPVPARVTITSERAERPELWFAADETAAVRPGIAYTSDGEASFELAAGQYRIDASRGSEWSMSTARVSCVEAQTDLTLTIRREVSTPGFIASDTHIHTLEFSGHGDASLQERLVTLAAEGVELAIATDHNHNIDYEPEQKRLELSQFFTSVVGNEVTSSMGHFNAFPLDAKDKVPEHRLADWITLIDGIRRKGAQVVILNHPRWPDVKKGPFGRFRLNRLSGERSSGPRALTFDAMELVNSTTRQDDAMYLFRDWFALLNHGDRVLAVGSSDSHTVGDPVGQGRTYVRSRSENPARIDIDEACESFRRGRSSISMGIFCDATVDDQYELGATVPVRARRIRLRLRVAAPSWIHPRIARVFLNGREVARETLPARNEPVDETLPFTIDTPSHDAWLVCVVTGDGIEDAFWRTRNPYTLGATNPIWLDVDGKRGYESPAALAKRVVGDERPQARELGRRLAEFDDAVAVQALGLVRKSFERASSYEKTAAYIAGMRPSRPVYARYLATLTKPAAGSK